MRLEDLIRPGHADVPAGEGTSDTFGGGPVAGFARRSGFGIRCRLRGESAVAELVAGGLFAALPLVFLRETGLGEAHELVQHGEFKLELDGVDHGFDRRFADIIVGEFKADEDDVHADTDAVDQEQLEHYLSCHAVVD